MHNYNEQEYNLKRRGFKPFTGGTYSERGAKKEVKILREHGSEAEMVFIGLDHYMDAKRYRVWYKQGD